MIETVPAVEAPLFMLQLPVEGRRLFSFARDQRLLDADPGYVVHALLAALFGADAPQPFALPTDWGGLAHGDPTILPVLAYARRPLADLQDRARAVALPSVYQAVSWDDAGCKPMPARFPAGLALGFEVRACPVVRVARGSSHTRQPGREVDAALAADWAAADGRLPERPGREEVYRAWLSDQMARSGGARTDAVEITGQRRADLFRRGARPKTDAPGKRPSTWLQRPDVVFRGRLEVTDPAAFGTWLARGVGRHRAFGFGMLLLRPL